MITVPGVKMNRKTIRFNDIEEAELELFKKSFGVDNDSEAIKMSISWCVNYIKNVTETFFPPGYNVIIQRKRKTSKSDLKVYNR